MARGYSILEVLFVLTLICGMLALYALIRAAHVTQTPWLATH